MSTQLNVKVQRDHIESLANVAGTTALMELIWNALDADATRISIVGVKNNLGYDSIEIHDNGHGMDYEIAKKAFSNLGGSEKKIRRVSPSNRAYHGEEGKGRYNSFGLGNLITFKSYYLSEDDSKNRFFEIKLERSGLTKPELTYPLLRKDDDKTGVSVIIHNVDAKKANSAFSEDNIAKIEQKLALYYQQYPNFEILINGKKLDFESYILNEHIEDIPQYINDLGDRSIHQFKIRILEWLKPCEKKLYYCNESAISFAETAIGVQTQGLNISAYLTSKYIDKLHSDNLLNVAELDVIMASAVKEAKKVIRAYIRKRIHERGREFIDELKEKELYPYKDEPNSDVEKATRQVFDIVALNINEYVPHFSDQDDVSKKFTLMLMRESLESDSEAFRKVLTEVIQLPQEKIEDLHDLLETTTLSDVIDTMKEVTDRLRLLYEMKIIVMDTAKNKKVLERKHLHKIVEKETWIFGDDYALGASDVSLKNVLKSHLKSLGRKDFESIVEEGDNDDLQTIPDVCLWKQYNNGRNGYFRNLVVELKRPSVVAGYEELNQITGYAQKVADDSRFVKDKTQWTFILLTNEIKDEIKPQCEQLNRKWGHVVQAKNYDVFVMTWAELFNQADARHQYLKEKLNYNISENQEGLEFLNARYAEYLPEQLKK